jgi:hypothetical protein
MVKFLGSTQLLPRSWKEFSSGGPLLLGGIRYMAPLSLVKIKTDGLAIATQRGTDALNFSTTLREVAMP